MKTKRPYTHLYKLYMPLYTLATGRRCYLPSKPPLILVGEGPSAGPPCSPKAQSCLSSRK